MTMKRRLISGLAVVGLLFGGQFLTPLALSTPEKARKCVKVWIQARSTQPATR